MTIWTRRNALLLIAIALILGIAIVIMLSSPDQKESPANKNTNNRTMLAALNITPMPTPQKNATNETIRVVTGACSQSFESHAVAIEIISLTEDKAVSVDINAGGRHTIVEIDPRQRLMIEAPFNVSFDGNINLPLIILADGKEIFNETIPLYCEPSSGGEKSGTLPVPTAVQPTATNTPEPTYTETPVPTSTGTIEPTPCVTIGPTGKEIPCKKEEIPEFPTIAVPMITIMALFVLMKRKKDKENKK